MANVNHLSDFLDKVASRDAMIGIIGLGYVGLPLAVVFAEAGQRVIGIDLDRFMANIVSSDHFD